MAARHVWEGWKATWGNEISVRLDRGWDGGSETGASGFYQIVLLVCSVVRFLTGCSVVFATHAE